ncbi:MAG: hypothetical protein AB7O67_04690 [Vicinamibacterales bacterium]
MGEPDRDPVSYNYLFEFADGSSKAFSIRLDPVTLELLDRPAGPHPDWTRLDVRRCNHCPLSGRATHCPVAVNLSHVVESFKDAVSYERAVVTVETAQRTYRKETTLARGLSAIIGIYNVTSNCPVLDRLRPMVRFHLPFASSEETMYRAVSMYLTAQYFVMRRGGVPDWHLRGLERVYDEISHVEIGLSQRLRYASSNDANANAVVLLAVFGQEIRLLLGDRLREIEPWFPPGLYEGLFEGL